MELGRVSKPFPGRSAAERPRKQTTVYTLGVFWRIPRTSWGILRNLGASGGSSGRPGLVFVRPAGPSWSHLETEEGAREYIQGEGFLRARASHGEVGLRKLQNPFQTGSCRNPSRQPADCEALLSTAQHC